MMTTIRHKNFKKSTPSNLIGFRHYHKIFDKLSGLSMYIRNGRKCYLVHFTFEKPVAPRGYSRHVIDSIALILKYQKYKIV